MTPTLPQRSSRWFVLYHSVAVYYLKCTFCGGGWSVLSCSGVGWRLMCPCVVMVGLYCIKGCHCITYNVSSCGDGWFNIKVWWWITYAECWYGIGWPELHSSVAVDDLNSLLAWLRMAWNPTGAAVDGLNPHPGVTVDDLNSILVWQWVV